MTIAVETANKNCCTAEIMTAKGCIFASVIVINLIYAPNIVGMFSTMDTKCISAVKVNALRNVSSTGGINNCEEMCNRVLCQNVTRRTIFITRNPT